MDDQTAWYITDLNRRIDYFVAQIAALRKRIEAIESVNAVAHELNIPALGRAGTPENCAATAKVEARRFTP